jgi:Arc/MetJ-type ribon-helix-helix transcriptional regulator
VTRTSVHLDDTDDRRLTELAARRGTSPAALIREAIQRLLATEEAPTPRPRPLGRSGHADTSERVDELLAGMSTDA